MKTPAKKSPKKKRPEPRPKKSFQKARGQERSMKSKSLADFVDKKAEKAPSSEFDTLAKVFLKCPHCGWDHDPEDLKLGKRSSGLVKCGDCGEGFSYEMFVRKFYSTYTE